MTRTTSAVAPAAFAALCAAVSSTSSLAQTPTPAPPNEITVTANRVPTAIQRTGSAITVIRSEEIQRANPVSMVDVLRRVPGLDIAETGGPGSTAVIRIRGANAGQTLVLLDGVRINDPSVGSGEFDTSMIAPGLIERIEVLRGPQSALYGSDAIGGVINIITKRGRGAPLVGVQVEAGSYGTLSTIGSISGSTGPWSYAASAVAQRTDGFSRYGYRIGRIESVRGRLEADGVERISGFGRIGYDAGTGVRFDIAAVGSDKRSNFDAAFGASPDTLSFSKERFSQMTARAEIDTLSDALTHSLQVYANRSERQYFYSYGRSASPSERGDFVGDRYGAEYQAVWRMPQFGSLIGGARVEKETIDTFNRSLVPLGARFRDQASDQSTSSLFALWQVPIGERLTMSFGGRYDKVTDVEGFATWRATAAYAIPETATKLRASAGTGAKAPTLYQRFSIYGTPGLEAERSTGVDAGIDQSLFGGLGTLSLTAFANRIDNLIDFSSGPKCTVAQSFGCFFNVAKADTSGLETSLNLTIVEGLLSTNLAYTYLIAKDAVTDLTLARRPENVGRLGFQITPLPGWLIEPSLIGVSERFSGLNETQKLAPYARFDIYTEYAVNKTFKVYGRVENITDAKYQEVRNYGTTGRAFYAGLTATW
jgi:vitamin B12 transporter